MTEQEMFEKSFQRPKDYFELSEQQRWEIDNALGILDWKGVDLTKEEKQKYWNHYE